MQMQVVDASQRFAMETGEQLFICSRTFMPLRSHDVLASVAHVGKQWDVRGTKRLCSRNNLEARDDKKVLRRFRRPIANNDDFIILK